MTVPDVVELAAELVRLDTANPPGNEYRAAELLAPLLEAAGFRVSRIDFEPGRTSLVALFGSGRGLCLSGHLDTVPAGSAPWARPWLSGEVEEGRLHGRGSADMKGGVAALACAAIEAVQGGVSPAGLSLVFTAGEETGCAGAAHLAETPGALPEADALLVAEPTANRPALGHKGVMWASARVFGRAAHGSLPHLGDNALSKAARAVLGLEEFFDAHPGHPVMGRPTLSVNRMSAGDKVNVVPDEASLEMDLRLVPGQDPAGVLRELSERFPPGSDVSPGKSYPALWTEPDDAFASLVLELAGDGSGAAEPMAATYFTDGAILSPALGNAPTVILGPGDAAQAHGVDEFCETAQIRAAKDLYARIIRAAS